MSKITSKKYTEMIYRFQAIMDPKISAGFNTKVLPGWNRYDSVLAAIWPPAQYLLCLWLTHNYIFPLIDPPGEPFLF